ncbi:ESPR-type extended signal peptide-containing protein [Avibacterium volantium]|uniref:Uncharacterized protein with a C-terminal OMP (Outer membrane protein) domain n=1 Tax=Avibacterium volantium TaxID=762 RepID=A0A3S4KY46_AVIVO|nr:ESPR-type extended signal peptide-containing protein [Avibacterium volantium]VEB21897.1 Uncharacterized protein with a C-terminal OMP (outer membrane protein) domain [Avibacterium volantium]
MNNIYKIIWSTARQAFVVVSELTRRRGKQKSQVDVVLSPQAEQADIDGLRAPPEQRLEFFKLSKVSLYILSAIGVLQLPNQAFAETDVTEKTGSVKLLEQGGKDTTIVIGDTNAGTSYGSVIIGNNVTIRRNSSGAQSPTIANDVTVLGDGATALFDGSVAIGSKSKSNVENALPYWSNARPLLQENGVMAYYSNWNFTEEELKVAGVKDDIALANQLIDTVKDDGNRTSRREKLTAKIEELAKTAESQFAGDTRDKEIALSNFKNKLSVLSSLIQQTSSTKPDGAGLLAGLASTGGVSVGDVEKGVFRQIHGVAAGRADSDAVTVAQLREVAPRYMSVKGNDDGSVQPNYLNDGATGLNSVAIGAQAAAESDLGIALGYGAQAGDNAELLRLNEIYKDPKNIELAKSDALRSLLPFGSIKDLENNANGAKGDVFSSGREVAIGGGNALGRQAISITQEDGGRALGGGAINIGTYIVQGHGALGIGGYGELYGMNSTSIGGGNFVAGQGLNVLGHGIQSNGNFNNIMGDQVQVTGGYNTVLGAQNVISVEKTAPYSDLLTILDKGYNHIIGNSVRSAGQYNAILGNSSQNQGDNNTLLGNTNKVAGDKQLLLGHENTIVGEHNSAIGSGTMTFGVDNILIGSDVRGVDNSLIRAFEGRTNLEKGIGILSGDTINNQDLGKYALRNAVALGNQTTVAVDGGVALGSNAVAAQGAMQQGYNPKDNSTIVDALVSRFVENALSTNDMLQYDSKSDPDYKANQEQTLRFLIDNFGDEDEESQAYFKELVHSYNVTQDDLKNALQRRLDQLQHGEQSTTAYQQLTEEQKAAVDDLFNGIANTRFSSFLKDPNMIAAVKEGQANRQKATWQATESAVSLGGMKDGKVITRQITNLAAGSEDTDAVNVAQLKAAQTHYVSINGTETEGYSNFANEGANYAPHSIAIGEGAKTVDLADFFAEKYLNTEKYDSLYTGRMAGPFIRQSSIKEMYQRWKNTVIAYLTDNAIGKKTADELSTMDAFQLGKYVTSLADQIDENVLIDKLKSNGAFGEGSVALGHNAKAAGMNNIAIGKNAQAVSGLAEDAIAIGTDARTFDKGIALGKHAISGGGISIGPNAQSSGPNNGLQEGIAIGIDAHAGVNSVLVGNHNLATGFNSVGLGNHLQVNYLSVAVGEGANAGRLSSSDPRLRNLESVTNTTSLGYHSKSAMPFDVAVGAHSTTDKNKVDYDVMMVP